MMKSTLFYKRLFNEFKGFDDSNEFFVEYDPDDMRNLNAVLKGPEGTPYFGGNFKITLEQNDDYPFSPPTTWFKTKIFHPNICFSTGSVCIDILNLNWESSLSVRTVLLSISSLLNDANTESPLNNRASELYDSNRQKFETKAR